MGFFSFNLGRRDGPEPSPQDPTPKATPQEISAKLTPDPSLGSELRNVSVTDPRVFSVSGLDERAHEACRELTERFRDKISLDPTLHEGFDKLAAHHRAVVIESTQITKTLLPELSSRHFGEYYSIPHFDRALSTANAIEAYLRPAHVRATLIGATEQPSAPLQGLAVEVSRAAGDFIDQIRADVSTIRAVSLREYPRGGTLDTVCFDGSTSHSYAKDPTGFLVFQNRDVVSVELRPVGEFPHRFEKLPVGVTSDGRHVIQQSGMQGCVGAATNMVMMDFGRAPDLYRQYESHFDNDNDILKTLTRAGLHGEIVEFPRRFGPGGRELNPVEQLRVIEARVELLERLTASGKGILLGANSEVGGHQIVLDRFSYRDDRATVRDPLHGWSIVVHAKSILSRLGSTAIVVTDPHQG